MVVLLSDVLMYRDPRSPAVIALRNMSTLGPVRNLGLTQSKDPVVSPVRVEVDTRV
jgi:hypothetical protein